MEKQNNGGAIFKNEKKGNDKAPDYKGNIIVDGVEKDIALWLREAKNGTKFFSVKISDKYKVVAKKEEDKSIIITGGGDLPF
jgi:uncharacterized protein (DUF736 family)